jgi:hypothetical protein
MLVALGLLAGVAAAAPAAAKQLFDAIEVDESRFVIVAVPIGSTGARAQLQIYEQIDPSKRPCFQVSGSNPATVNPLLGTFDFTGICRRYVDSQGYSARVGGEDLGSGYRFVVRRSGDDNLLFAAPAGATAGKPEMLVARSNGAGVPTDFTELKLEPGWKVKRRAFGGRGLGHVYLFREAWPGGVEENVALSAVQVTAPPPAGALDGSGVTIACRSLAGVPSTAVQSMGTATPLLTWFPASSDRNGVTPQSRCNTASQKLDTIRRKGELTYLTTGEVGREPVICAVATPTAACNAQNQILTLEAGQNPSQTLLSLAQLTPTSPGVSPVTPGGRLLVNVPVVIEARLPTPPAQAPAPASAR